MLENQIGGHLNQFTLLEGGKLMKKVCDKELYFYEHTLPSYSKLIKFCPKLFATKKEQTDTPNSYNNYVIMEDLCHGFHRSNILDIKMGITTADETATGKKLHEMRKKDLQSTTCELGMRITGMRVWNEATQTYVKYGKVWGRSLTTENFSEALALFFGLQSNNSVRKLIYSYIRRLEELLDWMSSQSSFRFYSSSLLFIFDAADLSKEAQLKMIDFAHVFPITSENGRDDGYIFGLSGLIARLKSLIEIPINNHCCNDRLSSS